MVKRTQEEIDAMIRKLRPGTQIAYVPDHADQEHPDQYWEGGFVTSLGLEGAWCRYWQKDAEGFYIWPMELRTKLNSEYTPYARLRIARFESQSVVNALLEKLENERK